MRLGPTSFDLTRLTQVRRDWCSIVSKKLSSSHVLVIVNKYSAKQGNDRQLIKRNIRPATPGGEALILSGSSQNIIATVESVYKAHTTRRIKQCANVRRVVTINCTK